MADTTTTAYGLTKPEIGASEDTWGTKINTDLDTLDTVVNAIGGKTAAATLSYADAAKIATTATGVDVTGTVTADGLTVDTTDQVLINHSGDGGGIRIDSTNATNTSSLRFGDVADNYIGALEYNHSNDAMTMYVNNATRMTLDASGNVLVGKTTTALATAGITLGESGFGSFTRSGYEPLNVNRLSSDGDLAKFYKDGTTVGSIGVADGDNLTISSTASAHGGLKFNNTAMAAYVDGASSNGTMDIGTSAVRFKDAWLSGGVYLGGTGSANKLDFYEEGTFTPTWDGYSPASSAGHYTRVGNTVTVHAQLVTGGTSDYSGVQINNLPFTVNSAPCGGGMTWTNNSGPYAVPLMTEVIPGTTQCKIQCVQSGSVTGLNYVDGSISVGGHGTFRWTLVYQTSA